MMDELYHYPLCPHSRKCRLMLAEKNIEVATHEERPWERRVSFLRLNPAGEVPVLVRAPVGNERASVIAGHYAMTEWLIESDSAGVFMPESVVERAEIRRLVAWFDVKFAHEVGALITGEKINRRLMGGAPAPDMEVVRVGLANLAIHMAYLQHLLERRDWLGCNRYTLADMAAAAHLSCLDYTGDVPWKPYPLVREWYARVKSRPPFRPLLADYIAGYRPPVHYADLDF